MMHEEFLRATGVRDERAAMSDSMKSALGRNKTYHNEADDDSQTRFRLDLKEHLRRESRVYVQQVIDEQHYATIKRISDTLSRLYSHVLVGGRLRYGTAEKAFNLYLKYLWCLDQIPAPPHCPVDSIVLQAGGIEASWTRSDSEAEYRSWIERLRWKAKPLSLAEWEYSVWLRGVAKASRACR